MSRPLDHWWRPANARVHRSEGTADSTERGEWRGALCCVCERKCTPRTRRRKMLMVPQTSSSVRASFDVPATMRDGTVLRANVFQPDDGGAGRYPVLLTRLPYGKDLPLGGAALIPEQAA